MKVVRFIVGIVVLCVVAFAVAALAATRFQLRSGPPSCWDVPTEVEVYSGLLNGYGGKPTITKRFPNRRLAKQFGDSMAFDKNGIPVFNVIEMAPLEDCDGNTL